jgi:branched-chain amino acid transport system ATP-binding protein
MSEATQTATAGAPPQDPGQLILDVRDLDTGYGEIQVLHGVSLQVGAGECVAVLGVNGAGKSTLMLALMGLIKPWKGTVEFEGDDVTGTAAHKLRRRGIGLVSERRDLFPTLTVEENLRCGCVPFGGTHGKKADARIEHATEMFPVLRERADQMAGTLSGGEQQMLAIARALVGDVKLLLLDEPSLGLSPIIVDLIYERLHVMKDQGYSMLLVEQHVDRALEMAGHGYVMDLGHVVASGDSVGLRESGQLETVYMGH